MAWTSGEYFLEAGVKAELILGWGNPPLWPGPQCIVVQPLFPTPSRLDILSIGVFSLGGIETTSPNGSITFTPSAFYVVTVVNNTNTAVTFSFVGGSPN